MSRALASLSDKYSRPVRKRGDVGLVQGLLDARKKLGKLTSPGPSPKQVPVARSTPCPSLPCQKREFESDEAKTERLAEELRAGRKVK